MIIAKNDGSKLAVSNGDQKIVSKSYHEKHLNAEIALNRQSLSQADIIGNVLHLIDKDMVIDPSAEPSGLVSEMVNTAGKQKLG